MSQCETSSDFLMSPHQFLETAIRQVFPNGAQIAPSHRDVPPEQRFLIIPSKLNYPRWIVPQDPTVGDPGLHYWQPYDTSSRLKWSAIRMAYRAGHLAQLPNVQSIGIHFQNSADEWAYVGWKDTESPLPVTYLGDPFARGKAVSFWVNSQQKQCRFVSKVPIGQSASHKVIHEAKALETLMQVNATKVSPDFLYLNQAKGIAAQELIWGASTSRTLQERHLQWMECMRCADETISLSDAAFALETRLRQQSMLDATQKKNAIEWLEKIQDPRLLSAFRLHGDFAPWNLKISRHDQSMIAVDWEEFRPVGFPLYDFIHFYFIQQYENKAQRKNILAIILKDPLFQAAMKMLGIDEKLVSKLYHYFLLDYWCRRLEEDDALLSQEFYFMEFIP